MPDLPPTMPLPEPGAEDAFYIVDLHCWMHRFFATTQGYAAHGFLDFIGRILREQRPSFFAVCGDLPTPTFRHELAKHAPNGGYKANREAGDGPDPMLLERIRWSKEMLEDVHAIRTITKRGYEADDLVATLARGAERRGFRVVVLALDKDLMQLVGERVSLWDGKRRMIGPAEVLEKFKVRPDQLRDYLAIVGDGVDNVAGIHGMGPVAAVRLLQEFGSLQNALDVAASAYQNPFFLRYPRFRTMLREQRESAALSMRLVQLADDAVEFVIDDYRWEGGR